MSVFTQADPRRPFKNIGESLSQGISQGFQDQKSQDLLDNVLEKAQKGSGDPINNLMQAAIGSGMSIEQFNNLMKSSGAPLAKMQDIQAQQSQFEQESDLINQLIGAPVTSGQSDTLLEPTGQPAEPVSGDFQPETYTPNQVDQAGDPFTQNAPEAKGRTTIADMPDNALIGLRGHRNQAVKNIAQAEIDRRKMQRSAFESDRSFETDQAKPFLKRIDENRPNVRNKEFAMKEIISALENRELGTWSKDHWADVTGIKGLRTAEGALFRSQLKEFLLSNISRAGSRPNQWIEQQISQMLPQIGESKFAQMSVARALKAETELSRREIEVADELIGQDRDRFGFVQGDIAKRVDDRMKSEADDVKNNLSWELRLINDQRRGDKLSKDVGKKVRKGTPLTPNMLNAMVKAEGGDGQKALSRAKRLGYTIVPPDDIRRWSQNR